MLTRKQFELLRFINERLKESGVPPSFDEMKDALDLRSKSGIHRLITALEERGFIRRLPNRARAIEVMDDNTLRACASVAGVPGDWADMPAGVAALLVEFRAADADAHHRNRQAGAAVRDKLTLVAPVASITSRPWLTSVRNVPSWGAAFAA